MDEHLSRASQLRYWPLLVAALCLSSPSKGQSILYVDDSAVGANDGSSWCDAFVFLQDALAVAATLGSDVSEIRVAQGAYSPDQGGGQTLGDREATFQLLNGVALRGGFAGCGAEDPDARDVAIYDTVLNGSLTGISTVPTDAYTSTSRLRGGVALPMRPGLRIPAAERQAGPLHLLLTRLRQDPLDAGAILDARRDWVEDARTRYLAIRSAAGLREDRFNLAHTEDALMASMLELLPTFASDTAAYHVVSGAGTNATSLLEGFRVTGGNALDDYLRSDAGGGLDCAGGCATIRRCVFEGSTAWNGGGLAGCAGLVDRCEIRWNTAVASGGGLYQCGGSIVGCIIHDNVSATAFGAGAGAAACNGEIVGTEIRDNQCTGDLGFGGGLAGCGGIISDCVISGNWINYDEDSYGGGMDSCNAIVRRTSIVHNFAGQGGGVSGGQGTITNSMIAFNEALYGGGGIHGYGGTVANSLILHNEVTSIDIYTFGGGGLAYSNCDIVNCTVAYNSVPLALNEWFFPSIYTPGGGLHTVTGRIENSIIWNNVAVVDPQIHESSNPSFSCVCGVGGVGNLCEDPMFWDPDGLDDVLGTEDDDLRLASSSPCVDAGNDGLAATDSADLNDNGLLTEPTPFDLDLTPRFNGRIDIGAYEFDCNGNGIANSQDIADQMSTDCDENGVPDDCQEDCNANQIADACEPDDDGDGVIDDCDACPGDAAKTDAGICGCGWADGDCDHDGVADCVDNCPNHANGDQAACRADGIGDVCAIADGWSNDCDHDGLPDECARFAADPTLTLLSDMNRFISFAPLAGLQTPIAIRLRIVELPAGFESHIDRVLWVGEPQEVSESGTAVDPVGAPGFPSFWAAGLQCDPLFLEWGSYGSVQVFHELIVPGGAYELQAIPITCATTEEGNFGYKAARGTARWGDLVGQFDPEGRHWPPPNGTVDVACDVVAALDKFSNLPSAPVKARVDLEPALPDLRVNITDVVMILDAFGGTTYVFDPPEPPCP